MANAALHYYRYVPGDVIINKSGGSTITVPAGWHNLSTVLARLRQGAGGITCSWNASTNRTSYSVSISVPAGMVRQILGHGASSSTTGNSAPLHTWVPSGCEFMQELSPMGSSGKRKFDFDYYISQSGQVGGLGVIDVYTERFRFGLVKKEEIFSVTGITSFTSPLNSTVFRPDLGLVFEIKTGSTPASVSNSSGYVSGVRWVHTGDIDIAMQMPPWDLYFTAAFEANRYI